MYVLKRSGYPSIVFEIKTDCHPYTYYTAIGQLLYFSSPVLCRSIPQRILVLPDDPPKEMSRVLQNLKIKVLKYVYNNDTVSFPDLRFLDRLLDRLPS